MNTLDRSRIGVVVSARTGSARLHGKALLELGGRPMLGFLLRRIAPACLPTTVILATTCLAADDALARYAESDGIPVFRGAEADVVRRHVEAAQQFRFDYVVRVTGDCPFVDAQSLDFFIESAFASGPFDLASTKGEFPVGIDYEMYRASSMAELHSGQLDAGQREHLTKIYYDREGSFLVKRIHPKPEWRDQEHVYTVDTPDDYARARQLVAVLGRNDFSISELVAAARTLPRWMPAAL